MEEVLDVYHRPRDPAWPLVCLDETSKKLIKETRVPIPARPGRPARTDYEYNATEPPISSCCSRRSKAGGTSR